MFKRFCSFDTLQLLPLPASYPVSPDDSENSDVQVCYYICHSLACNTCIMQCILWPGVSVCLCASVSSRQAEVLMLHDSVGRLVF